ncbi:MAG: NAD(P)/FAD-dependent oxidoreductase [Anaerolineales bacterium]|nr:NAD(P)/FAD-dependent oxidoreductase [Anaerolineales bacterium]
MTTAPRIAIVGAGFGGLGAAIRLRQAGCDDFLIFERAGAVGGVWRDNAYPGAACDVESHLYSYSFAPNPGWTRTFSPQPEIWAYLERCVREFGLAPHLRFNHEVLAARWEAAAGRWQLETSQGPFTAQVLVLAPGALAEPALPDLPGQERFTGPAFHSARWPADLDLRGKAVAVVGTGASAIQFVPALQPLVSRLALFQRTPPWVLPRVERAIPAGQRRLFARWPITQRLLRLGLYAVREASVVAFQHPGLMRVLEGAARRHLARAVADPDLRARLTPRYTIGCKRILLSNTYYPALIQPNVAVITAGVAEVRPRSIVDGSGAEWPAEALIFGTGFRVTEFPFARRVRGRAGRTLAEVWAGSPQAHLGTTVAGFPNLFLLQGPNTGLGHTSVLLMLEAQLDHLLGALRYLEAAGAAAVEPRAEAQAAFVRAVDERMRGTVWVAGGCRSWYLDATGRNSTLWPGSTWSFRRRVARFNPREYQASG